MSGPYHLVLPIVERRFDSRVELSSMSSKGFSLIEFMISAGLFSMVVLAMGEGLNMYKKSNFANEFDGKIVVLREHLLYHLGDAETVRATVNDPSNSSFDCIKNVTDCPLVWSQVRVREKSGELTYYVDDPDDATVQGFDFNTDPCQNAAGGTHCSSVIVEWFPICRAGDCKNPIIRWRAQFRLQNRPGYMPLDPRAFELTVLFSPSERVEPLDITVGLFTACASMSDETLACWGSGGSGALSRGTFTDSGVPMRVSTGPGNMLKEVKAIVDSHATLCAIVGPLRKVVCWGENDFGQCGRGTLGVVAGGTADSEGYANAYVRNSTNTGDLQNVDEIYWGENHTCARVGTAIYCWGLNAATYYPTDPNYPNYNPVLPIPNRTPGTFVENFNYGGTWFTHEDAYSLPGLLSPSAVATLPPAYTKFVTGSGTNCMILPPNGQLMCWGYSASGQLGLAVNNALVWPDANYRIPAVGSPPNAWDPATQRATLVGAPLTDVVDVDVSSDNSCALVSSGNVVCWGRNYRWWNGSAVFGLLGNGDTGWTVRPTPNYVLDPSGVAGTRLSDIVQIDVDWTHTCALNKVGEVFCWGPNMYGEIGDGTTAPAYYPKKVKLPTAATKVSVGGGLTCAHTVDKQIYCWGNNVNGGLGIGSIGGVSSVPVRVLGLDQLWTNFL
jgi:alpha-tubulin suppressor-like RCC1 family protein